MSRNHGYRDDYVEFEEDYYDEDDYDEDDYVDGGDAPRRGRSDAALRRRNILFGLVGTLLGSALFGLMAPIFWDLTLVAFVATVAYVGLMAYAATKGSITLSKPSLGRQRDEARHVARAVIPGHGYHAVQDDLYEDEYDDEFAGAHAGQFDDEWWDEPRQAVAR